MSSATRRRYDRLSLFAAVLLALGLITTAGAGAAFGFDNLTDAGHHFMRGVSGAQMRHVTQIELRGPNNVLAQRLTLSPPRLMGQVN